MILVASSSPKPFTYKIVFLFNSPQRSTLGVGLRVHDCISAVGSSTGNLNSKLSIVCLPRFSGLHVNKLQSSLLRSWVMHKRLQAYIVILRNESLNFGQKGTLEATIVRALQMTSPPARSRGLSALSAKNPTGTKANAYSTCIASDDQEWVLGHKLYLRKVCFFSAEFKTHCHTRALASESSRQ